MDDADEPDLEVLLRRHWWATLRQERRARSSPRGERTVDPTMDDLLESFGEPLWVDMVFRLPNGALMRRRVLNDVRDLAAARRGGWTEADDGNEGTPG